MLKRVRGSAVLFLVVLNHVLCNFFALFLGVYWDNRYAVQINLLLLWFLFVYGVGIYSLYKKGAGSCLFTLSCWWGLYTAMFLAMQCLPPYSATALGHVVDGVILCSATVFFGLHPFLSSTPAAVIAFGFGAIMTALPWWLRKKLRTKGESRQGK